MAEIVPYTNDVREGCMYLPGFDAYARERGGKNSAKIEDINGEVSE